MLCIVQLEQLSHLCTAHLQVGSYAAETATWTRPEDMITSRPNITISTVNATTTAAADLVGNAAAALAAASMVWESMNSAYAAQTLLAAKDLYAFAQSVSITQLLSLCCSVSVGVVDMLEAACCALEASAQRMTRVLSWPVMALQVHSDLVYHGMSVLHVISKVCMSTAAQHQVVLAASSVHWHCTDCKLSLSMQGSHCRVHYYDCCMCHRCQVYILRSIQMRPCHILLPHIWTTWLMLQRGCTSQHRYVPLCLHKSICSNVLEWAEGRRAR